VRNERAHAGRRAETAYLLTYAVPPALLRFVQSDDEDTPAVLAIVKLPLTFISKHLQQPNPLVRLQKCVSHWLAEKHLANALGTYLPKQLVVHSSLAHNGHLYAA
jgi:hypothetical protein